MKTKRMTIIASAFLISMIAAKAQVPTTATTTSTSVEGSPYLDEQFEEGEILQASTRKVFPLRYNIYQDIMEYKQNGQPLVLDANANIKKVKIKKAEFVIEKFEFKGNKKNGFLTLLDSGKMTLYSKKVVTFTDAKRSGNMDGTDSPPRFTRSSDIYFYKIGNAELVMVESLKKFLADLPEKKEEMTQYAKKEKLSTRKEKELIKLVDYFNTL